MQPHPTSGAPERYLTHCTECDELLTKEDIAANADDALELTGGYGCRKCMKKAEGFAPPPELPPYQGALYGCSQTDPAFVISLEEYREECHPNFQPPSGLNIRHLLLCDGCLLIQTEDGVVRHQTYDSGDQWVRADWFYQEQRQILNDREERLAYNYGEHTK